LEATKAYYEEQRGKNRVKVFFKILTTTLIDRSRVAVLPLNEGAEVCGWTGLVRQRALILWF